MVPVTRDRSGPPASLVTPALLEQVRERAQIVDLFAATDQKRAGREFLARCPWHDDRRPSLTVSPKRNRVHCFVCGKGTDAIGWLQEQQGMSFQEAVLELSRRCGVTVAEGDPAAQRRFEQEWRERRALMAQRTKQRDQFHRALVLQLEHGGAGADYLSSRGISPHHAIVWQLGFAAGRLVIPLNDASGQTVGFCGRATGNQEPKYRNSTGDLLFQRNGLVFGLDQASESIRREGTALLVEGPLDVIQLHQAGFRNAVACLGTSVSALQLQLLRRHGLKQLLIASEKLLVQLQDALLASAPHWLEQALRRHSGMRQETVEGSGPAAAAGGIQSGVGCVALPEAWSGGLLSGRQRLERRVLRLFIHAPDCRGAARLPGTGGSRSGRGDGVAAQPGGCGGGE